MIISQMKSRGDAARIPSTSVWRQPTMSCINKYIVWGLCWCQDALRSIMAIGLVCHSHTIEQCVEPPDKQRGLGLLLGSLASNIDRTLWAVWCVSCRASVRATDTKSYAHRQTSVGIHEHTEKRDEERHHFFACVKVSQCDIKHNQRCSRDLQFLERTLWTCWQGFWNSEIICPRNRWASAWGFQCEGSSFRGREQKQWLKRDFWRWHWMFLKPRVSGSEEW